MSEETTNDVNTIDDLIKHSLAQDYNKANEVFGNVMTIKLADVLDQQKIKIAGQIYNGDPADEEDPLDDEDFEEDEIDDEESDDEEIEDEEDDT
jgi:hypothetical protein